MALLRSLRENATLFDLRRTYADLLEKLRPYGQRLMRGPPRRCRSASGNSSRHSYRVSIVVGIAVARILWSLTSGFDESVLVSSLDSIEVASVNARLEPILRYVRKLTETPSRMTVADTAAGYDAGWNDEALLHAIAVCAYFNNMNRLVECAGVNAPTMVENRSNLVDH
jgi:hypothetical protein